MRNLTCVVSARLHSARVERKMVRPFAGSSLLEICLRTLLACPSLAGRIWLSSREEEITEVGERLGVKIWRRGPRSLDEPSDCRTVHDYAVGWQGDWGWPDQHDPLPSEWFVHVSACNPLLTPETIEGAVRFWQAGGYPSLMAVVRRDTFFFDGQGLMLNPFHGDETQRATLETKLVGPVWEAAHSLYIWHRDEVANHNRFFPGEPGNPFLYPIPPDEFLDIDEPYQWDWAETLYLARQAKEALCPPP